jgi:hypothetical protein
MGFQLAAQFYIAAYYALVAGAPPLMPELANARVKLDKNRSGLEIILKTPSIGDYELLFKKSHSGPRKYYLDNFDFNTPSSKVNVYNNTAPAPVPPAHPSATASPFSWRLTVQNDRVLLTLAHTFFGKVNLYFAPDATTGDTVVKRASAFTAGGIKIFSYRR